jgi:hypothetical protein
MTALDRSQALAAWLVDLDDLDVVSSACDADGQRVCWSKLLELFETAPVDLETLGFSLKDAADAQKMADAAGWESAVLLLLETRVGYLVSRGASNLCLASIALNDKEVTAEGNTTALALISAISRTIIETIRDSDLDKNEGSTRLDPGRQE